MSSAHDESGMIGKFLGPERASGSPFDLLGVPPRDLTPAEVVGALEARLGEVDRHTECRTPSADEVRLALHATAAQLMDPVVRGGLIRRWEGSSRGTWASPPPPPVGASPMAGAKLALEGDAVLAMAMEGGWNERSLQRLCMFAHARGLTATDVASAIQRLARPVVDAPRRPEPAAHPAGPAASLGPRAPIAAPGPQTAPAPIGPGFKRTADAAPPPRPRTFELTPEEVRRQNAARLKVAAGVIGCGTLVVFTVATGVIIALRGPTTTPPAPPPITTPGGEQAKGPTKAAPPKAPPPKRPSDVSTDVTAADAVARQLTAATDRLKEDPADAAAQFAAAVGRASGSWVRWSPDELLAVQDAVIEYLYKAERSADVLHAAADAMSAPARAAASGGEIPAERVLPAAWSAGLLSRVVRERDLPASVGGPCRLALATLLGSEADLGDGTFGAGLVRAVTALAPRLAAAPDPEAWRRWLEAVGAATPETASRGRLVVAALDAALTANADPLKNPRAMESISVLATALTWRAEEQTRGWMFRWFDSADISTPALHALTAAVASRSSAEGVNPSMVLSAAAGSGERAELRAKYAAAWADAPGGVRSELLAKWEESAATALQAEGADAILQTAAQAGLEKGELRPHVAALLRVVTMSRLSEMAAWMKVGDTQRASLVIGDVLGSMRSKVTLASVRVDPLGGDNNGAWAIRYLTSMTTPAVRTEMLKQAQAADALTALECEVVASEAVRGLPASVREAARKAAAKHRGLPAMLNALLNLVPVIPVSQESATLIEELTGAKPPPLRDARWREAVRRAVVERLLELAAGKGEFGVIDTLATLMGTSYRERLAALGGAEGLPADLDGAALLRLASTYRARWDKEAERIPPTGKEPSTLGQIRQRGAGRAGVAANVVQRFAAEQATTVELMAHVVAAEDAARAEAASTIIAEWNRDRRAATHVFDQMAASERAMLALWRLRMKGGGA